MFQNVLLGLVLIRLFETYINVLKIMSYQSLKFKLCYALCFVYNRKDILRLVYNRNVSSCLKAMPSVVIIWNLLLKTQPAAAHSYYFQSVILAWFVSLNFDSKSRTVPACLHYLHIFLTSPALCRTQSPTPKPYILGD